MDLQALVGQAVRVRVTKIPFDSDFTLHLDNGYSEELTPDETRLWFKSHGVTDIDGLERGLDEAWNFYETVFNIEHFRVPKVPDGDFRPQI